MSALENAVKQLAERPHSMAIPGDTTERCPHCGAMRFIDAAPGTGWARPHLVEALVREARKT